MVRLEMERETNITYLTIVQRKRMKCTYIAPSWFSIPSPWVAVAMQNAALPTGSKLGFSVLPKDDLEMSRVRTLNPPVIEQATVHPEPQFPVLHISSRFSSALGGRELFLKVKVNIYLHHQQHHQL